MQKNLARTKGGSVIVEGIQPELDCGRYPVKREVGDDFEVRATIFKEGHDKLFAVLKHRVKGSGTWTETPMEVENPGLDLWRGSFVPSQNARYEYTIEAWMDKFETWRSEVVKKVDAGQHVELELKEGRAIVAEAAERSDLPDLNDALARLDDIPYEERLALLMSPPLRDLMAAHPDRSRSCTHKTLELFVDRVAARYAAWYEMFHRSQGTEPGRGATFREAERRLPEIADMGFDVLYLLPVHPIGRSHRKGPNNTLNAGPNDPGSPYAIGSEEGGHKDIHPELGTLEDFRRFVGACREHGMEVALDFAIQCSPDHPYIKEHPEWFLFRPDGSIKYAENPPKKYQDIVNVDFDTESWESLWDEWRNVLIHWIEQGVKIFRVDNPHTKAFPFWEWVIGSIQEEHPDVIFLAEAFTRPRVMENLAKLGFTQSYTYFTWRTGKQELTEYLEYLTQEEPREYMRPNFFPSTPDINPWHLQSAPRHVFQVRLLLAATLSSVYGMYNGFELCEGAAVPGKEEYLNSEKYDYKVWDWDRPGNIKGWVRRVNEIRRDNPALHELTNLRFHEIANDGILFYSKIVDGNAVLIAANLDPDNAQDGWLQLPLELLGLGEDEPYVLEEQFSGHRFERTGRGFWVRLVPEENPAEVFRIRKVGS